MPLDLGELRELLSAMNQTDIAELTLKSDDYELTLRRGVQSPSAPPVAPTVEVAREPQPVLAPAEIPRSNADLTNGTPTSSVPRSGSADRRLVDIPSPMVGTFYRSPRPEEPPFVEVGSRIQKGQTVCIIEAMKLMNELESETTGEIVEILVENGEPVEYGQPLMRVNPTP